MVYQSEKSINSNRWRNRAEEKIRKSTCDPVVIFVPRSAEETQQLIHELQVHQVELAMQNEELQRGTNELDDARACYFTLYDLAPVGYVTVNHEGIIS